MRAMVRSLRNREIIDEHTSALLDDLRTVGNTAAHSNTAEFTKEDAMRYRRLADQVIALLENADLKEMLK
jgi:hypothetical protein